MRIAIVAPAPVPFTLGGAERVWAGLHRAMHEYGERDAGPCDAELVKLAVREDTLPHLVEGYRDFSALDLSRFDMVVTSKYPAWMVGHPNHVVWMFHPLRGVYDTYHTFQMPTAIETGEPVLRDLVAFLDRRPAQRNALEECFARWDAVLAELGGTHPALALPSPIARALVRWLDAVALATTEVVRHLALSRTVAARPGYFPRGITARVVYPPPDVLIPAEHLRPSDTTSADGGRPLFTVSRLDRPKRLDLLIRAMSLVPGPTPLLIGGTGPAEPGLRALAAADDRVRFLGFVPDDELAGLYRGALAVPFLPADEDLGLITLEAMACATPVVTCTDSGGPTEFVIDGVTGRVVEPTVDALCRALTELVADPEGARRMGTAAQRRVARIGWPSTIAAILGHRRPAPGLRLDRDPPAPAVAAAGRPRLVVTTTFAVGNSRHGGQLRCLHLYGALARHLDVDILSLVDEPADVGVRQLAPGLREIGVARSAAHREAGERISSTVGMPVTDIVAGTHIRDSPAYLASLQGALRGAAGVILAEPYLLPAVEAVGPTVPRLYDAFNVESDLKAGALPGNAPGCRLLQEVHDVERRAVLASAAITTCSAEDAAVLAATHARCLDDFTVVPNGSDFDFDVPTVEERRKRRNRWLERWTAMRSPERQPSHLAVFFASWHPPNLDAAEILLWLAPQLPEVQLVLGGSHGDAFRDRRPPANVVFTGVITDRSKRALLAAADVALNPMLLGSGTNLKVIEYLAAGVPVVSTRFGVRGLAAVDGTHLVVAEPHEMVAAVRGVLADPVSAAERAAAGREFALARYDWQSLGDRLARVVEGAVVGRLL